MEYKYSYHFTEKAEQDLDELLRYISVDLVNPAAAQNLGRRIFEQIDNVRAFPDYGAPVDNEFLSDKTVANCRSIIISFTTKHITMKKSYPSFVSFTENEILMKS